MKRIIILLLVGVIYVCCQPETYTLDYNEDWVSVSRPELSLAPEGDSQDISITSQFDWTVLNVPQWLSISKESGVAGVQTISIAADMNDSFDRSATIEISFTYGSKTIVVSQNKYVLPQQVYTPGSHNNWTYTSCLKSSSPGTYEGYMRIGGPQGFTIAPSQNASVQWGLDTSKAVNQVGVQTYYPLKFGSDVPIMSGSEITYSHVFIDLTSSVVRITPIKSINLMSSSQGLCIIAPLEYVSQSDCWRASSINIPYDNNLWFQLSPYAANESGETFILSGDINNLDNSSSYFSLPDGCGIYSVELYLSTIPYRAIFTKESSLNTSIFGVYTASNYKAFDWGPDHGGAASYNFNVTITEYPDNPNRVLIYNLDPLLYQSGIINGNNMLYAELSESGSQLYIPSEQNYYESYYFMSFTLNGENVTWRDYESVSVLDGGRTLAFNSPFCLYYYGSDGSGFVEAYTNPLYLTKKE